MYQCCNSDIRLKFYEASDSEKGLWRKIFKKLIHVDLALE